MKLEGKVAIVTGGGQGIGRGIALCLAEEGADVTVVDIDGDRNEKGNQTFEKKYLAGKHYFPPDWALE